jgi:hypothetical protein
MITPTTRTLCATLIGSGKNEAESWPLAGFAGPDTGAGRRGVAAATVAGATRARLGRTGAGGFGTGAGELASCKISKPSGPAAEPSAAGKPGPLPAPPLPTRLWVTGRSLRPG